MIKTFRHKGLKLLFESGIAKRVQASMSDKITRRLDAIDAATTISDLDLPGFKLHELTGNRRGTWSLNLSRNYRITFKFKDGDAFDLELEDYH